MNNLRQLLIILLVFLFTGCTGLPEYALPKLVENENFSYSTDKEITYRSLKIEDFRAKTFPGQNKEHADRLGAKIRTLIRLSKSSTFHFDSNRKHGQITYHAKMENIVFEAAMLPDYSWWSPKLPPFSWPYTLQHEQIHFALTEIAARQLSKSAREDMKHFVALDSTKKGAAEQLQDKIKTLLRETLDRDLQIQLEFDLDTSLHFDPEKQQEWFENVNAQLQELR